MHGTKDHTSIVVDVLFRSSSIFCHYLHQQPTTGELILFWVALILPYLQQSLMTLLSSYFSRHMWSLNGGSICAGDVNLLEGEGFLF